jgi:hypothetical protein
MAGMKKVVRRLAKSAIIVWMCVFAAGIASEVFFGWNLLSESLLTAGNATVFVSWVAFVLARNPRNSD